MTRWLRALALLVVPRDWRETVRADLADDAGRDGRRLSGIRYPFEAVRIGVTLRWRDRRLPAVAGVLAPLGRLPFELRLAIRSLRRAPWFTATVVGVMALVLTLATTVFAIVDGVLFRPLPYPESERLFQIEPGFDGVPPQDFLSSGASVPDLEAWSAAAPGVRFTGFSVGTWIGYGSGLNDNTAGVAKVQPNFFDTVAVQPLLGGFSPADLAGGTRLVPVIITFDLWQGRFAGDPEILGREVIYDPVRGNGYRIVGVMPESFWFPSDAAEVQFLRPEVLAPEISRDPRRRVHSWIVARLPDGLSVTELESRIERGMVAVAGIFPDPGPRPDGLSDDLWRGRGPYDRATVTPLATVVGRRSRSLFLAVFAAAGVLVLLGVLNTSSLAAARVLDRRHELAVHRALGASRTSLARSIVLESMVTLLASSALAMLLAKALLPRILVLLPDHIVLLKPWGAEAYDGRILWFGVLSALVLTVPAVAWPLSRAVTVAPSVGASANRSTARGTIGRFVVVSTQVAGALVLTVVGAMLVQSLLQVYGRDLRIRTDDLILVEAEMLGVQGQTAEARKARVAPILSRVREVAGVRNVAATAGQVLVGPVSLNVGWGYFEQPARDLFNPYTHAVTAEYFNILQPQLVAGRLPTPAELSAGAPVVVVSESLARDYWPGRNPLGETLRATRPDAPFDVIGVVRDVPWLSWDTDAYTAYGPYAPLASNRFGTITLMVEHDGASDRVIRDVVRTIESIQPPVTARSAGELIDVFAATVNLRRFRSWLFGGFAAAALMVVGAGILGLLAMSTARRTREVGIRQSLGATPGSIVRLFVKEQMRPVVVGLVIGAMVSAWAVHLVESYLFGVTTTDPLVWTASVVLIVVTAGTGALIPSLRASTTSPTIALRAE